METKQVIVIRKDLKMRRGKEIAQGAHASMKVFFDRMERVYWGTREDPDGDNQYDWVMDMTSEMEKWKEGAFTKVCLKVNSEEELLEVYKKAEEAGIPCSLIVDSGKTEFNGVSTTTCCAIGPDNVDKIDTITGNLNLY